MYHNDLAIQDAFLYHARQNVWKLIKIKGKGLSEMINQGNGYPRELILDYAQKSKNKNGLNFYKDLLETNEIIIDLGYITEKIFFYLYGTTKENLQIYKDNLGLKNI